MPIILATQVRAGMIVNFENELCRVISVEHQTPGNLPARVQVKMKRLKDGINRENRFGSSDKVEKASLEQHMLEFLYEDGASLIFMNNETYEQLELAEDGAEWAIIDALNPSGFARINRTLHAASAGSPMLRALRNLKAGLEARLGPTA